jgi:hypothetical protein
VPKVTTIAVRPEIRERLRRFGMAGESYDAILSRLLDERTLELVLPRWPPTPEEVKKAEKGPYVSLAEVRRRLGI